MCVWREPGWRSHPAPEGIMGRTAVDFTGNKAVRLVHYCSKNYVLNIPSLSIEVAFSSDNSSTSDALLPRYSSMAVSSKITIIKPS